MLDKAIKRLRRDLLDYGRTIKTQNWQGMSQPPAFHELLNANFEAQMPPTAALMEFECKPWQPFADTHFAERVSGIPHNPPPSSKLWLEGNETSLESDGKFSHTYAERMHENIFKLVELFKQDPTTRQGYLPIWFEEDGDLTLYNKRVPCSIGYHFIFRDGQLHCFYPMRSVDAVRHFHHDVYFAAKLTLWLIQEAGLQAVPGTLSMHMVSFHCFANDLYALGKLVR